MRRGMRTTVDNEGYRRGGLEKNEIDNIEERARGRVSGSPCG